MPKLNLDQVKKELTENHLSVQVLMDKFWRMDSYGTVLTNSIFLEALIAFVAKRKSNTNFSKFEFYKYFFDNVVKGDEVYREKLWGLGLELEKKQANELLDSEMIEVLSRLKLDKQELLDKGLFAESEGKIGFVHHTISEFLVAEKWIIEGKIKENLSDMLIKESDEIFAVNCSWSGVIRFLLDSNEGWSETYGWLWNLASSSPIVIDGDFSDTITSVDPNRLIAKKRSELFGLVFHSYLKKRVWIPLWTRTALPSLCGVEDYKYLKKLVLETEESEPDYLTTIGNMLNVVARLMNDGSVLMDNREKSWWRERLVDFANCTGENGVIQRHALSALSSYTGDLKLIGEVDEDLLKHESNLVREAYLDFCSDIDPNSEVVIDKLVKGLTEAGEEIYSRHGLYKISNQQGVLVFLKRLDGNGRFLKLFLDKESIFNSRDRNGDEALIKKVGKFIDGEIAGVLKSIIKKSLESKDIYNQERSYFVKSLVSLVYAFDRNYVDEILSYLESVGGDKAMKIYDYIPLFVWFLTPDNVEEIYKRLSNIDEKSGRFCQQAIYRARFESRKGKGAYKKAIKLKIVEEIVEEDWKAKQTIEIYQQFKQYLGDGIKKIYYPAVFEYFWQNKKVIFENINWLRDKKRLKRLVIEEGLRKIDPKQFKLTITKGEGGKRTNQYSISRIASYFGDVVKTAQLLHIPITGELRQNLVNFIPFAYSDDREIIMEMEGKVSDEELKWVNSQYLGNGDIKYFLPDSYIYFAKFAAENNWGLATPKKVLIAIANDGGITDQDRRYALETLGEYITENDVDLIDWLRSDFGDDDTQKIADDLLISVFKDRGAIESRIRQIKDFSKKAIEFKQPQGFHSVGKIEDELMEMHLAKPLFCLGLEMYAIKILGLLEVSADILYLSGKGIISSSVEYLWKIVFGYIDNLDDEYSIPLSKLIGNWINSNSEIKGLNWIQLRFEKTRRVASRGLTQIVMPQSIDQTKMLERENSKAGNKIYVFYQDNSTKINDSSINGSIIGSVNSSITKKII